MTRNIKIEVWTDGYYARFIGIWYPEEEQSFDKPEVETRPEQLRNLPALAILTTSFKGRREVVGNNPVVPSQHPMPIEFLKEQTRGIAYMFANDIGIFQPESKAQASTLLSRMAVGFNKVKEMRIKVTPPEHSMTLFDLKNSLANFTDEQLKKIKVVSAVENPLDSAKKGFQSCIHTIGDEILPQFITVTKSLNVYDVENPYINNSNLPTLDDVKENQPGMEGNPIADKNLESTNNAIGKSEIELEMLKTIDKMVSEAGAKDIIPDLNRKYVQKETIKALQKKLGLE